MSHQVIGPRAYKTTPAQIRVEVISFAEHGEPGDGDIFISSHYGDQSINIDPEDIDPLIAALVEAKEMLAEGISSCD